MSPLFVQTNSYMFEHIVTHHRELGAIIPIHRDDGVEVMLDTSWGRLSNGHGGCAPTLPTTLKLLLKAL